MSDVILRALRAEEKRVSKAYEKAKANAQRCMHAGSELMKVHEEAHEIIRDQGSPLPPESEKKIEALAVREKECIKASKKNLVLLLDNENRLRSELEEIQFSILKTEFDIGKRN